MNVSPFFLIFSPFTNIVSQDRITVEAEEAGMDAFMDKPFKLEELTAVYTKLLEMNNQRDHASFGSIGIDTPSPGVTGRTPRSIRNITSNARIFVDAKELDDLSASASPIDGDPTSVEQKGTSTKTLSTVGASDPELRGKVVTVTEKPMTGQNQLPPITRAGSGIGGGSCLIDRMKNNHAKVHVVDEE